MPLASLPFAALAEGSSPRLEVSHDQALRLAQQAYWQGDLLLANGIARRILAQNPRDPAALLLIAATGPALGEARLARRSGGAAWREAGLAGMPEGFRHEIARFTASAALAEGRPMISEYWLRRALDTAPDITSRNQTRQDLSDLRARRKLSYRLNLGVTPSSNLNGGAGGKDLTIDGTYYVGPISTTGQKLSGLRADVEAGLTWRFAPSKTGQTSLDLSLATSHNWLSATAQARIDSDPMLATRGRFTGSDLDETTLEATLAHDFALGKHGPAEVALRIGQTWYAGERAGPMAALSLTLPLHSSETGSTAIMMQGQRQWNDGQSPSESLGLRLMGDKRLGPGSLRYGVGIADQSKDGDVNSSFRQVSAQLGYAFDPKGPIRVEAMLSAALRDQDDFRLGPVAVTDGRHDRQIGLSVSVGFPEMTVMGLEPSINLSGAQTTSNISRYDGTEMAVGFGLSARF